ncbi:glycosyltransferase [Methanolobus tindarius DSM 2278]|uniref:Glycosyltransferase n=2 Tax=Methanolobus tindarius TaxID=2221 RepID=W9DTJ6_METTI|nr:glycosyltransferase [Methanolobus tindarius DSM 2278]
MIRLLSNYLYSCNYAVIDMKLTLIHPAHMDYRKDLFEKLNQEYDVTFVFTKQGRGQKNVFEEQERIPENWNYSVIKTNTIFLGKDVGMYIQLIQELFNDKSDIIITSTSWHLCWLISKIKNKKFILMTEFWHWNNSSFYRKIINLSIRMIAKRSDAIFAMGTKSYSAYSSMDVSSDKLFVHPQCAVDYSNNPVKNLKFDIELDNKIIFLFIGRLVESKGVDVLLRAFSKLEQEDSDVVLIVGGDGHSKTKLEVLSRQLGIKNIQFTGRIEKKDISSYYSMCDVFVLPSIFINESYEPWGLVVNEAMAFGKAIIASSAVGSAYDLISPNQNGYIVRENSSNDLYSAMKQISHDKQRLLEMGNKSRIIFDNKNNFESFFLKLNECIEFVANSSAKKRSN